MISGTRVRQRKCPKLINQVLNITESLGIPACEHMMIKLLQQKKKTINECPQYRFRRSFPLDLELRSKTSSLFSLILLENDDNNNIVFAVLLSLSTNLKQCMCTTT